jgi:phosphate-selective porin OprO/OprP
MNMNKSVLLTGAAVIAIATGARAADKSEAVQPLLVLAQNSTSGGAVDLAARVQALESALAIQNERATADRTRLSTLEQSAKSAAWSFDNGRPTFATSDGRFTMAIRARLQADFAGFMQDSAHPTGFAAPNDLSSGMVMRRAFFGIEGKAYGDFAYEIRLNVGGADGGLNPSSGGVPAGEGDPLLSKAVITYTGIPHWHFNVGVIEPSFMMEGTTASNNLIWIEKPEIDNIAADSFGAGDARRGIEAGWSRINTLWDGDNLAFDVAFTGGKAGSAAGHGNGGDEQSQILGRIADRFWSDGVSNFQAGMSLASVLYSGNAAGGGSQALRFRDRPEIRVDGTRLIDTGAVPAKTGDMIAFDLEGNYQNFFVEGEWARFRMDRQCGAISAASNAVCTSAAAVIDHPSFEGFTLGATWILTGEAKTYTPSAINETQAGFGAPVPARPFSGDGANWGAWELVARYSDTDLNWNLGQTASAGQLSGIAGGEQKILALGVNWYFNRNVRLALQDNIVSVKKGVIGNPGRDSQDLNIVGIRVQYSN